MPACVAEEFAALGAPRGLVPGGVGAGRPSQWTLSDVCGRDSRAASGSGSEVRWSESWQPESRRQLRAMSTCVAPPDDSCIQWSVYS